MKLQCSFLLAAGACLVAAQSQPAAPAAPPPGVEESLRERVRPFYQAHVDGKYRKAYDVVADENKDAFLTVTKPHYDGFEIQKIVFSDDYTTATVTTEIHTSFAFYGRIAPEKVPVVTYWKAVDGQWYWYVPSSGTETRSYTPAQRVLMNMFHFKPDSGGAAAAPGAAPAEAPAALPPAVPAGTTSPGAVPSGMPPQLPPGFPQQLGLPGSGMSSAASEASASSLLQHLHSEVLLDKDRVEFHADRAATATVLVKNTMSGPVQIAVAVPPTPGLTANSDKAQLGAGESATITIVWKPAGRHVVPPPASCSVSVRPLGAVLPFTVTFR